MRALLGPTNTGKTHLALEELLSHDDGIIGFPLRLLAREAYDRLCARVGADKVALVTGEEKLVPRGARYFACTVEAMPRVRTVKEGSRVVERPFSFVAVDEIHGAPQLPFLVTGVVDRHDARVADAGGQTRLGEEPAALLVGSAASG